MGAPSSLADGLPAVPIEWQLSWAGQLAFFAAALTSWLLCAAAGHLLLSRSMGRRNLSLLEQVSLTGPWGLLFLVSLVAAVITRGRSQLTVVLLVQISLWAQARRARPSPAFGNIPSALQVAGGALVLLLFAHVVYRWGIMPSYGRGRWHVAFFDYGWYGQLARWLVRTGIEHYSIQTIPALAENGAPYLAWYHWGELWFTGALAEAFGFSPLLVLTFVTYPLCLAMTLAVGWALLERLSGSWVLNVPMACALALATPLVNRAMMPSLDALLWAHPIAYYTNFILAIMLSLTATLGLARGTVIWPASCLAVAVHVGPGLLPLTVPGVVLWAAMHIARRRRLRRGDPTLVFSGVFLATLALLIASTFVTGHEIRSEAAYNYADVRAWSYWWRILRDTLVVLAKALLLAAPLLWGAWIVATEARVGRSVRRRLCGLCVAQFVAAYPVAMALRGDGVEKNIVWLMWSAFVVPLGWIGLVIAARSGRRALVAVPAMLALVASGLLTMRNRFADELYRFPKTRLIAAEVDELRSVCRGEPVGYFCVGCRDNQWWVPVHSTWAALSDCRMIRLNSFEKDGWAASSGYWRRGAARQFAVRRLGLEWENTPAFMLGFAESVGIRWVAESDGYPLPNDVRPYLGESRRAGPFRLYRIQVVPDPPPTAR
jgi:hypothetical protein